MFGVSAVFAEVSLYWLILILVSTSSETGLLTVRHNGLKGVRNAKNSTD